MAHDFNNLLTAMDANATFLLEALGPNDPRRDDAEEIKRAAQRAASLTRQLAFSRRQVLQPRILDVNTVEADMDKMLRRSAKTWSWSPCSPRAWSRCWPTRARWSG